VLSRAALIVAAGAAAYWNSLAGPFIFDDNASILTNPRIRQLGQLLRTLAPPPNTPVAGRPIVNLSFAVNYTLGGLEVTGYHVVNIVIHVINALLLFGIARRTLEFVRGDLPSAAHSSQGRITPAPARHASLNVAFAIALLWVVHPLNSEAVDYLTQRTESLMALFYLATLYASIRAARFYGDEDAGRTGKRSGV
jgi:hypothetical protein